MLTGAGDTDARLTAAVQALGRRPGARIAGGQQELRQQGPEGPRPVRTGNAFPAGEAGLRPNELYPQRYPQSPAAVGVSRAQVKTELAEATRNGDMFAAGEGTMKLNEEFPQHYPANIVVASGKTHAEVNAETLAAIRTGNVFAAGEGSMKLNQEFPQRYAKARAVYAAKTQDPTGLASSTSAR